MAFSNEQAVERARKDLAERLSVNEDEIREVSVDEMEFPDMALGAAVKGEMSGQMMTSGWRIRLTAAGKTFEYRANSNQIRLFNHKGANYKI
jgi:CO/xanthine dehydrogenase Mo-binding subunit